MHLIRFSLLSLIVLHTACGAGAQWNEDGDLVDPLAAAGKATVTAQVTPNQAAAGEEVQITLTATITKAMIADLDLFVTAPDGTLAYAASWPAQAFSANAALTFQESLVVEAGDPLGAYLIGARLTRTGAPKPSFESGALSTLTVKAATTPVVPPPGGLPAGWTSQDIGSPTPPGTASAASGTFIVSGAGADIWGTSDSFHFVSRSLVGDGILTARVASQTHTNAWAKAGLMVREGLLPTARHASIFVTPSSGVAFQRRATTGGSSVHTAGPAAIAPYWLRLVRKGSAVTAFASVDGNSWTQVGSQTLSLPGTVQVGLAVTSHASGVLSTAAFDQVTLEATAPGGTGPQRLALLASAEELQLWRARASSGPFKSANDHSPGSPGEWTEMTANAAAIDTNPSWGQWAGPSGTGLVTTSHAGPTHNNRRWARDVHNAALVALIQGNPTLANKVRTVIVAQASLARVDFADKSQWNGGFGDVGMNFGVAELMRDLLLAWDLVTNGMKLSGHAGVDAWFRAYAYMCAGDYDKGLQNVFPNRGSDNYSQRSSWVDQANHQDGGIAYYTKSGQMFWAPRIQRFYNNRRNHLAAVVGLTGLYLGDSFLIENGKRYGRELVMFGFRRDGVYGDYDRIKSHTGAPLAQLSLGYSLTFGTVVEFADALARSGDRSLYDFVTNEGSGSAGGVAGTAAPNKSFRELVESYAKHVRAEWDHYGTDNVANAGNPAFLIQPLGQDGGGQFVKDSELLRAAAYYQDPVLNDTFTRKHSKAVKWNAAKARDGWQIHRRILFMTGDTQGQVYPYP